MKTALLLLLAISAYAQKPNIVFVGDSFTWGYQSGSQQAQNYPLLTLSVANPTQYDSALHNNGVSGQRMGPKATAGSMLNVAAATIDTLIVNGKVNIIVVEGGGVDINVGTSSSAAVYTSIKQYYTERKAAGWNYVIGTTIVSGQNNCYSDAIRNGGTWANTQATYESPACTCPAAGCGVEPANVGTNQLLRGDKGDADYLIDLDVQAPFFSPYDFTWRQSDGHWLVVLNQQAANLVGRKLNTINKRIFPMGGAVCNCN